MSLLSLEVFPLWQLCREALSESGARGVKWICVCNLKLLRPLWWFCHCVKRRRWGDCLKTYWCFRSHRHSKRVGPAVLFPGPNMPGLVDHAAPGNQVDHLGTMLPFVAPPSSPASFLPSEPSSVGHSPARLLSLNSRTSSIYSPRGSHSVFTIGPYAYETQLVSPPVFSTFTTEPSTAALTPQSESVRLTTPSSPEVPVAQFLTACSSSCDKPHEVNLQIPSSQNDFQSNRLFPGSPVGHLISRSSVVSRPCSSSFADIDFPSFGSFSSVSSNEPVKLLTMQGMPVCKTIHEDSSGSPITDIFKPVGCWSEARNNKILIDQSVSFDVCTEVIPKVREGVQYLKSDLSPGAAGKLSENMEWSSAPPSGWLDLRGRPSVIASKQFKFDGTDEASDDTKWWTRGKNWTFFSIVHLGIS